MKSQWLSRPIERGSGEFENLARAMKRNRVCQFEFALLLRLLSNRFPWESHESRALRVASFTARRKGKRLTDLLRDLRYGIVELKRRRPSLLVCVYLTKLMPSPLVVAWLNQVMEKQVYARILDSFRKGQPRNKSSRLPGPSPSRLPRQQVCR
jgi:hypothetical protein